MILCSIFDVNMKLYKDAMLQKDYIPLVQLCRREEA